MKILLGLAAALGASASFTAPVQAQAQTFPDPAHSWLHRGSFPAPADVDQVRIGLSKRQIYPLLGPPHFGEGLGPTVWNYVINFYTGAGSEYVTCQLRLHFTKGRVDDLRWSDPGCADRTKPAVITKTIVQKVNVPGPVQTIRAEKVVAQFSILFDFDKSTLDAEAQAAIQTAAAEARKMAPNKIIVVGATDRAGDNQYNIDLSVRRAKAVAMALSMLGDFPIAPVAAGAGEDDLAVPTPDGVREAANRRAVITFLN